MTIPALPSLLRAHYLLALMLLGLAVTGSPRPSFAQNIVVMVNGEPITDLDIEQRSKLDALTGQKQRARQDVINDLIDEKVKIKEGKKFGVDPTSADVDQSFGDMASRMRINAAQLAKVLEGKGIRPETLKQRIKADIVWGSLVRGRYKERLQVGEKDVAQAVQSETGAKLQVEGVEYKMRPVVLIVPRGSPQTALEARHKEAESLRSQISSCDEAKSFFAAKPNTAVRDVVTKTSSELPEPLRKLLDETAVGHMTPPEVTKQGIEMVVLCSRQATMVDTPKKREIRDKMYQEKYLKTSNAYLHDIRKAAMIEYRQR